MRTCRHFCFAMLLFVSLAGLLSCDTASNTEDPDLQYFVKYYGGDGDQSGVDMLALQDGSFLLLGNSSAGPFNTSVYLVRVDAEGEVLWQRTFDEKSLEHPGVSFTANARDLEPTVDGNFIILSDQTPTSGGRGTDIKLRKVSPEGVLLDSVGFGTEANDYGRTVTPLRDGRYVVSGTTELTVTFPFPNDPDPDLGDIINYAFDANLDMIPSNDWSPVVHGFGANLDVAVKAIELQSTNGFYVFGHTNSTLSGVNSAERLGLLYFQRNPIGTDPTDPEASKGGSLSSAHYPGNVNPLEDTEIKFVDHAPAEMGGGYIVVGTSRTNLGGSKIFLARLRSSLTFSGPLQNEATLYITIPLQQNIRGVSAASSLTGQFGYLVLGDEIRSSSGGSVLRNFFLSKVDQSGAVLWSTTFGSELEDDFGAAVTELPDGKIFILGTMGLADKQSKMALIKMNPQGQLLE